MSRSVLGRVLLRSSSPPLLSPAASSSPCAGRFLSGAAEALPSAYHTSAARYLVRPGISPASAAARSFLLRSGLSPASTSRGTPTGIRSYKHSSRPKLKPSTKDIKDKETGGIKLADLKKWFLRMTGHPSQMTARERNELWLKNLHKPHVVAAGVPP